MNPQRFIHPKNPDDPDSTERIESVIELPMTQPHHWIRRQPGVLQVMWNVTVSGATFWMTSISFGPTRFRTNTADTEPHDLLVLFDGWDHLDLIPAPTTLDNLLFDGSIKPTVAVLVESPSMEARMRDLGCHPPFVEFLANELIPWVRAHYRVTTDPGRTTVGGVSHGELAAAFAAFERPDVFNNVLSQSGSFWWKPEEDPEPEWLTGRFADSPRLPLRFYLDVGLLEPESQLVSNRRLRDILRAKEYPLRYIEYNGAHDYISWRRLLGDGLIWLVEQNRSTSDDSF